MSDLYTGTATFSMPNGPTVEAQVDLWIEEHGPLVEWGGTAEAREPGILWNGGQRVTALRFGSVASAQLPYKSGRRPSPWRASMASTMTAWQRVPSRPRHAVRGAARVAPG
jgi:hypothetical protein